MNRTALALAAAGTFAALAFTGAVAAPAVSDWWDGRHDEYASYATGSAAKADRASVPRWLPDAAASVEYGMKTTGGDRALKAGLPSAELPAGCTPLPSDASRPAPVLTPDWFPEDAKEKATARCGLYYAYTDGHTLYAWQDNQDWIKDNKAGSPH
ncbi:lipoprotein [Streptomyces platensis subsp. clarensis]|uniref:Lipoprotein n=1 Tax=Streptomyces showdoensis TaxID=68268 RepID=A0A2P2GDZ6_STREW|nr:hypothetical protein [Streptomyces showdoensis]KKZ69754.1 lipoprotein [Streptomyces showdoensis]MCW7991294.1 lipoprotein [Streptomyces platensis subsp. clarensis]